MRTSFSDSDTLGKFNENVEFIGKRIDDANAQSEELKSAYQRIKMLEADLEECREFIEVYVDVNDGEDGQPVPNKAMRLVGMIDESIHGPGNF